MLRLYALALAICPDAVPVSCGRSHTATAAPVRAGVNHVTRKAICHSKSGMCNQCPATSNDCQRYGVVHAIQTEANADEIQIGRILRCRAALCKHRVRIRRCVPCTRSLPALMETVFRAMIAACNCSCCALQPEQLSRCWFNQSCSGSLSESVNTLLESSRARA